jgi:hypothetical protein
MKKTIKYKGRDITMKCVEMSHCSVGGEYEIGFCEKIQLSLDDIQKNLKNSGYKKEKMTDRSLSLVYNNSIVVTILKKGGLLIQNLLPDTFEEAVKIGEEILNAEQKG